MIINRLRISLLFFIFSLLLLSCRKGEKQSSTPKNLPHFNGDSAYCFVAEQCAFGPRVPQSEAHEKCLTYFIDKFTQYQVDSIIIQSDEATLYNGEKVKFANLIAQYNKEAKNRIIICSHWDSRPFADMEEDDNQKLIPIDGANDGASGVGVILELARLFAQQRPTIGVDLILFDLEDYGAPEWEDNHGGWALGSAYWAEHPHTPSYRATYAILLDMVGAPDAKFYKEYYSVRFANWLVDKCWKNAAELGYNSLFINAEGGAIMDDHIPINQLANIPAIDIVHYNPNNESGFPPTWHTHEDNIKNISPQTLERVGTLLLNLIY